jgi:hypothetical protein
MTLPAAARLLSAPAWLLRRLCDEFLDVQRVGYWRVIREDQLPELRRLLAERGYPRSSGNGAA